MYFSATKHESYLSNVKRSLIECHKKRGILGGDGELRSVAVLWPELRLRQRHQGRRSARRASELAAAPSLRWRGTADIV